MKLLPETQDVLEHFIHLDYNLPEEADLLLSLVSVQETRVQNQVLDILLSGHENFSAYHHSERFSKRSNPLQPNERQIRILKLFSEFHSLKTEAWLERIKPLGFLSRGLEKDRDYERRARYISSISRGASFILLMDGHGRMVYRLLELCPNSHIVVVDQDSVVNQWHEAFFPRERVSSIQGDIFDIIPRYPVDSVIYLNFCGISGLQIDEQLRNLNSRDYLISYSTIGLNKHLQQMSKQIRNRRGRIDSRGVTGDFTLFIRKSNYVFVSQRKDFSTLHVKPIRRSERFQ